MQQSYLEAHLDVVLGGYWKPNQRIVVRYAQNPSQALGVVQGVVELRVARGVVDYRHLAQMRSRMKRICSVQDVWRLCLMVVGRVSVRTWRAMTIFAGWGAWTCRNSGRCPSWPLVVEVALGKCVACVTDVHDFAEGVLS